MSGDPKHVWVKSYGLIDFVCKCKSEIRHRYMCVGVKLAIDTSISTKL